LLLGWGTFVLNGACVLDGKTTTSNGAGVFAGDPKSTSIGVGIFVGSGASNSSGTYMFTSASPEG